MCTSRHFCGWCVISGGRGMYVLVRWGIGMANGYMGIYGNNLSGCRSHQEELPLASHYLISNA